MRIDHINTHTHGGAAVAALRLHDSLSASGVDSRFCYQASQPTRKQRRRGEVFPCPAGGEAIVWSKPPASRWETLKSKVRRRLQKKALKRALRNRPAGLEIFSLPWQEQTTPLEFRARGVDIVHLHWISSLIDYPSFFAGIDNRQPIVWTLHDMNPLTGGCHHADACSAYQSACHKCPQLGPRAPSDLAARVWETKLTALRGKNLHLVAPSRWMERVARESRLGQLARSVRTIYHGFDLQDYSPRDKSQAKRRLGLSPEALTVGAGAASLRNPRKGFQDLLSALAKFTTTETIHVLTFGQAAKNVALPAGVQLHSLGYLDDATLQSEAYSAMDVFALPSRAESFGLVSAEAMACGVPVVAYNATAVPEYVLPEETGLLAELGDVDGLARHLQRLLDRPEERLRLGAAAREFAVEHFDQRRQTRRHLELYQSLVEEAGNRAAA